MATPDDGRQIKTVRTMYNSPPHISMLLPRIYLHKRLVPPTDFETVPTKKTCETQAIKN